MIQVTTPRRRREETKIEREGMVVAGAEWKKTVGLISSAPHKISSFVENLPLVDCRLQGVPIAVERGVRESDSADPVEAIIYKLNSFLQYTDAMEQLDVASADAGGVLDVLFTLNTHAFSTDREGVGAVVTITEMARLLREETCGCRPVTIPIWNVSGWASAKDIREYGKNGLRDSRIETPRSELLLTLSPGIVELLSNKKRLLGLHQRGYLGPGVLKPSSVGGIDWVTLVGYLPDICAAEKDDLWMGVEAGDKHYCIDEGGQDKDGKVDATVSEVTDLLNLHLRGAPVESLQGIKKVVL